ncbi:MAG: DNA gyrase subunit A [Gammaproteobacteria bacterium]|jgi:DNA gyrase subunit A|nr:DNA gyrase subunit A [Gammaproteobacteria bacterium]MBT4606788.1 DNA gyrase subunit A [Thiotrichales bacterium]MBT3471524.1 DNA gyrase subunit A [Gammaproteobacteria bacterium]MBT3967161.1 DNA gyrase subunit A [Gammaproteobacteria bacterium]MBT4081134.1 DNA gyrase subunit A [Gammaproteobacteria bacterium]
MTEFAKEVLPINIEEEMRKSYLDYAMSVIVGRALPDARDGLKPVHRRVLYAMHELGNDWNKAYKKSARIVGDVIGKYHPHGDTAVYDTIVRMAQPFSLRYMLVDGQGNFGSVDGDSAAAMRYTEIRMSKIAHDLLMDLDKETVDFTPNYDESEHEPAILPTRLPNLLINGSEGIAVGMATKIPPHNLTEVVSATIALVDNPELEISDLMEHLPGPDFPTGAIINGVKGIHEAYRTGRGRIYLRSLTHVEGEEGKKQTLVVDELPFQVNKARLLERIGELVREKKITGISGLRDESDKDGMRMVIELKRGEVAEVVRNNLFKHTAMQNVFGINMVALVDGQPQLINLKQALEVFIRHRREVVTRRTLFELRKARERAHVLEGLAIALTNIDPIIALIKSSTNPAEAKTKLMAQGWPPGIVIDMLDRGDAADTRPENLEAGYGLVNDLYQLSPVQAQAILDLKLHRLTGLEKDKILEEYKALLDKIAELLNILRDPDRLMEVIREELVEMRDKYGDERKTEITQSEADLSLEDLITEEDMVVTLSNGGYAKAQPVADYSAQRRGGRGKSAAATKDEDFIEKLIVANSHDTILCFSTRGRLYWLKVYQLPQAGRTARGRPINNLLPLEEGERITAFLPVREYTEDQYVFMATTSGIVKKTPLTDFSRPRTAGIIAVELRDEDELVGVELTNGERDIMLFASGGKAVRFNEAAVRAMGRTARGVKGMVLAAGEHVISLLVPEKKFILSATENGFGKRTLVEEFASKGRGIKGVYSIQTSERNGAVVGTVQVDEGEEIMMISDGGTLVRTRVDEVSISSRNTQGVTLIRLGSGEKLVGIERVEESESQDEDEENDSDSE